MICFINRSSVDYDVRLQKYVRACIESDISYCVIAWDRLRNSTQVYPNEYQYRAYAPYGYGWRNFFSLIGWVFFAWFMFLRLRKKYKVIHACNMENCLVSYPFRLFGKKIILDVYDSQKICVEAKLAKIVDGLILPSTQRLKQIGIRIDQIKHYLEVENVPFFQDGLLENKSSDLPSTIRLAYVGVLQKGIRGIENVLKLVNYDERFHLDIAGTGGGLDEVITNNARKNPRIHYHGKVNYSKALEIMNNSDFIVALYYLIEPTHKYASPNKYYESLYLAKPIITSNGTLVGNNVQENNTGYVVGDTIEELRALFDNISTEDFIMDYAKKQNNCKRLWEESYSSYFENVLKKEYLSFVQTIALE